MGSIGNGGYHSAWCQNMDKDGILRTGDALAPGMDMDMLTGASQNPLRSTRKSTEESSHSVISPVRQEGRKVLDWIDPIQPLLRHMEAHVASMGKATGHIYDSTDLLGISGLVEGKIYGWNIRKPMGFSVSPSNIRGFRFQFSLRPIQWLESEALSKCTLGEDWNLRPHTAWSRMLSLMLYWKRWWPF